MVSTDH